MKENAKENASQEVVDPLKRKFLKGCGITVLTAASYQIISILTGGNAARADMCNVGCVSACVDSCTGCTTVNCTSGNVPEPSPPVPVEE